MLICRNSDEKSWWHSRRGGIEKTATDRSIFRWRTLVDNEGCRRGIKNECSSWNPLNNGAAVFQHYRFPWRDLVSYFLHSTLSVVVLVHHLEDEKSGTVTIWMTVIINKRLHHALSATLSSTDASCPCIFSFSMSGDVSSPTVIWLHLWESYGSCLFKDLTHEIDKLHFRVWKLYAYEWD